MPGEGDGIIHILQGHLHVRHNQGVHVLRDHQGLVQNWAHSWLHLHLHTQSLGDDKDIREYDGSIQGDSLDGVGCNVILQASFGVWQTVKKSVSTLTSLNSGKYLPACLITTHTETLSTASCSLCG